MRHALILAAGFAAMALPAHAATFTQLEAGSSAMVMEGYIEKGDDERRVKALTTAIDVTSLFLNSPGGDVAAGYRLAAAVRYFDLNTVVFEDNHCLSMCAVVWAAGVRRFHFDGAQIGVHSAMSYTAEGGLGGPSDETGGSMAKTTEIARVMKFYGMPDVVIGKMVATPGNQTAYLTNEDVAGFSTLLHTDRSAVTPPPLAYVPPASPVAPQFDRANDWSMTCTSTASGKAYEVTMYNTGDIDIGAQRYSYEGHYAKNDTGAFLAKGKTRYGHFVAVFHSTKPQPYVAYVNTKGERVKDWCQW